jgi:FkbM family methyltransferase
VSYRLLEALRRGAARATSTFGHESPLLRVGRPAYEAALRLLARGRGLPASINGTPCRLDPAFRWVPPSYEPQVAAFLEQRVGPGDLCLDVGANIGLYVIQFAHWSRPHGRVVAFEPNPRARFALERHIRINHLTERVEVFPYAVGADPGRAVLHVAGTDGRSRLHHPNPLVEGGSERVEVEVISLDDFCMSRGLQPDWILIDVEGFEAAVLQGAKHLIEAGRPKLGLVVECHPSVWHLSHTSREDFETLLRHLNVQPFPLTGQRDPLSEYGVVHLRYV